MRRLMLLMSYCLLLISTAWAQTKMVSGKVKDATGSPVVNASVVVKGTQNGTTTRADGSFSITVPSNAKTLIISAVGMTETQVAIGAGEINVTLENSDKKLQEVVVVGYGTQKKSDLTSAITQVGGDKLAQVPMTSVDQILQGKVAGLQSVSFSGQPGANQQIRIRGIGSSALSSQPTFVVDGIIINSGDLSRLTTSTNVLAQMNPDDIESVSVLKDAAATAIYGSLGSNGVIIITTKSGKAGRTRFTATGEVGNTSTGPTPKAGRPLRANDWLNLFKESIVNAGYTQATADATAANYGDGTVDVDWLDLLTRKGTQQQYNISASGGDEKTKFYASGGYFKQESNVIGSDFKRISSVVKIEHNPTKKLNLVLNLQPTYSRENAPISNSSAFSNPMMGYYFLRPTQNPYNADGSLNTSKATKDFSSTYNPLYIVANDIHSADIFSINGKAEAKYNILKNLSFSSKMGLQYNNLEEYYYNNPTHGDGAGYSGRAYSYYTRYFLYDWVNQLDYHADLLKDKDLRLDAVLGYEALTSKNYNLSATATNFPTPRLIASSIASTPTTASASWSDYAYLYMFGRANLNYKGKYLLGVSLRRDGSSKFSENHEYGWFPSGSIGWIISNEKFMENVSWLNNLKVRASYGQVGNANGLGNYSWRQTFGYGLSYNGQPGGGFNTIGNTDLRWESSKQTDIGLDAAFLDNRINVTFDYYIRNIDNMIYGLTPSLTTGFASISKNIGKMKNEGIELTINATPVKTRDFTWDLSFNISKNNNTVVKTQSPTAQANGSFILAPGHNYYEFYLRRWAGVDPSNGDPLWYSDSAGTVTTNNYNSAPIVATGKTATPKYFGGLSNTFTYKQISISADLYYNYGNYVQDSWASYLNDEVSPSYGKYSYNLNRWQKAGDVTDVPKLVYNSTNKSSSASTRFLYKGDFIRLRNVTVGYNASPSLAKKLHLTTLNIYARGTNLWTKIYDDRLPFDPEQSVTGQANLNLFYNKTFTLGLNLGF
ncbi:MAG: TonB-dependent receptor [Chitinophagaceae bacterium]